MTGTSTSTPTTVASAAPEFRPNKEIAAATANSKKFDVPIRQAGAAILDQELTISGMATFKNGYIVVHDNKTPDQPYVSYIDDKYDFKKINWDLSLIHI